MADKMTRRESLQWAAAGLGVFATGLARGADESATRPLDLLILGGTGFLGPHQVETALARGHRVTLFNRGRSAPGLYGERVEVLIGNRDTRIDQGLTALQGERRWDVVIDNSGYLPRHVRDSVTLLKERVGRYLYVSTVAVYDPSGGAVIEESSPLRPLPDPNLEDMTWANYGPLKAECDRIVRAGLGDKATIVRPISWVRAMTRIDSHTGSSAQRAAGMSWVRPIRRTSCSGWMCATSARGS